MISRRNIRVKVMQTLYSTTALRNDMKPGEPLRLLQKHFDGSRSLLLYLLHYLTELAGYAEQDAHQRSAKHLPSAADLNVNTKLAGNLLIWQLKEDESLQSAIEGARIHMLVDREDVRRSYQQMAAMPEYQLYIQKEGRDKREEAEMLSFMLQNVLLDDEQFTNTLEEKFSNWSDDGEMVLSLLYAYLKKPSSADFNRFVSVEKLQFARTLLSTVLEKEELLASYITPRLKNWDAERLATIDTILLRMGVSELLFFETIPPKVTINEYIELAKEYSTAQSGQFINGILDNVHRDLVSEGKLQKTEFKK